MKHAVVTFGCRVNQADSQRISEALRRRGSRETSVLDADLVIVNTCSVTASADQGARQTIRRVARTNPQAQIVATGCYATRRPEELTGLPNVVQVIPNGQKETLVEDLPLVLERTTADRYGDGLEACGDGPALGVDGRTVLTIRVQTGCDEACTYCIIPRTRGTGRSTPMPAVVREVELAAAAGFKEIVLTGVHLGSYGRDLDDATSLHRLLERLERVDGDFRIRVSSLEPMDCTPELVQTMARSRRFASHLHLPLQHGADELLATMRRPYTSRDFVELTRRVRLAMPDASLGSDVIVGFPGETDEHVEALCGLLDGLPLSYLHVFPYSDRPGTVASRLRPKVDGAVIRGRATRIRAIGAALAKRFRDSQRGTVRRALALDDGRTALTDNFLKVPLDPPRPRNSWVDVTL